MIRSKYSIPQSDRKISFDKLTAINLDAEDRAEFFGSAASVDFSSWVKKWGHGEHESQQLVQEDWQNSTRTLQMIFQNLTKSANIWCSQESDILARGQVFCWSRAD